MWCDGGDMNFKNAEFIHGKVATERLFKPMLLRGAPAGVRQREWDCEQKREAEAML